MYRMIFQYRWAAIVFVLLTIVGAVQLVGTEEQEGKLAEAQQQVVEQREQLAATTDADLSEEEAAEEAEPFDEGFSDDADLLQDAEGMNPNPEEDAAEEESPVQLVVSNEAEGS
jgi:hypothetical protein